MYIKQSELFTGTSMDFVKKFMDITETASHQKGEILFKENDPAKFFFILLNGCVKLSVGEPEQVVYEAKMNGEAFGWSSLIGGDVYSASAECLEATKLLKTDRDKLTRILKEDAENGIIFFRHLAATLGKRLLQTYRLITPQKDD
ncbi:MAG: cyclic nucleotide-binding domain-containing protein [Desulfobacterales bacterium]|jgi:CRP-like cAMP-binding protein